MHHLEGNALPPGRLLTAQCHRVLGLELALGLVLAENIHSLVLALFVKAPSGD